MNEPHPAPDEVPRHPRKRWISHVSTALALGIALGVLYWFAREIQGNWGELSRHLSRASWQAVAAAVASIAVFLPAVSLCYANSLRVVGAVVRTGTAMNVYLASQLGKYVPGKFVYVASQIGLAKWLGVSVGRSTLGFTVHHLMLCGMGLVIASPLLGVAFERWAIVAAVVVAVLGLIVLASGVWVRPLNVLLRKRGKQGIERTSRAHVLGALASIGVGWVFYGCFAAVLSTILLPEWSPSLLVRVGIAAVAAWLMGFLSFITPAGFGVREGAFVLLTRTVMPEATAMTVAVLMRIIHTGLQIPIGAIALGFLLRARGREAPGAAGEHP
ncbi:MAG: flippase-like domain-containing protein [Candidatus Krumholzibacteria bacterium]|nr:flippase-like domain-containing protein [Candidatus Krumholzibacteria bacterium]